MWCVAHLAKRVPPLRPWTAERRGDWHRIFTRLAQAPGLNALHPLQPQHLGWEVKPQGSLTDQHARDGVVQMANVQQSIAMVHSEPCC
eukprot:6330169-Pyramimonas_sp.AAC.1